VRFTGTPPQTGPTHPESEVPENSRLASSSAMHLLSVFRTMNGHKGTRIIANVKLRFLCFPGRVDWNSCAVKHTTPQVDGTTFPHHLSSLGLQSLTSEGAWHLGGAGSCSWSTRRAHVCDKPGPRERPDNGRRTAGSTEVTRFGGGNFVSFFQRHSDSDRCSIGPTPNPSPTSYARQSVLDSGHTSFPANLLFGEP